MQKRKSLPAIYPFIVTASPPVETASAEGLRYLPDIRCYLYQRMFEYDPDSENNEYERVFEDTLNAMPDMLRDKDSIVLIGIAWQSESGHRCCIKYGGYDREVFGGDITNAVQKKIFEGLPAEETSAIQAAEDLKDAPSEPSVKIGIEYSFPPDLHAYYVKKGFAGEIYTRSKEDALLYFMECRAEAMEPPWLYCGVRRKLVARRRGTMYAKEIENTLTLFQKKGIKTKPGMTNAQIEEAEKCFGIVFPDDYKALLKVAAPVSEGFCDWTNLSEENIRFIQGKIEDPFMSILFRVKQEPFNWHAWWFKVVGGGWPDAWGPRPKDVTRRMDIAKKKIKAAPPLIPVFNESYISRIPSEDNNPVFDVSMVSSFEKPTFGFVSGLDIWNYFQREFADSGRLRVRPKIEKQFLKTIPFWSDLIR